jgi:hypothetical protein
MFSPRVFSFLKREKVEVSCCGAPHIHCFSGLREPYDQISQIKSDGPRYTIRRLEWTKLRRRMDRLIEMVCSDVRRENEKTTKSLF